MARAKIAMIGGGSVAWMPRILRDVFLTRELSDADIRLLDIDPESAERVAAGARRTTERARAGATFTPTTDPARALDGADFVVITLSTGGLDAMEPDLKIPERYGIFQTVGDTVGPGGWARAMRNIPVFARIAEQCRAHCPSAFILNYTNPMATLTKVLTQCTPQPVVGLCHGLFENYQHLMRVFGCKREEDIRATYGGVNHFFWMLDFTVKGKPGLPLLKRKLRGGRRLDDLVTSAYSDAAGHGSMRRLVASELFEEFGVVPYLGDRHTCEFFGRYLAPTRERLKQYGIVRTSIADRRRMFKERCAYAKQLAEGKKELELTRSRETAADIMAARWAGREFVDVMNLPNSGQIANLPMGAVVETAGLVNATGFAPIAVGALPTPIQTVVMPHALNQELIVSAGLEGNWETAYQALINDPLCGHLTIPKIKAMGRKLLEANRALLPQFFGRKGKRA